MKKLNLWLLASLFVAVMTMTACSEDSTETPSATDPYPYPEAYNANKDLTVKPGDSFYDYCNGTWLAQNPIPTDPSKTLGGLYEAGDVMEKRVEELKANVPDLKKYYALVTQIHMQPEATRAYINAQKTKIQKPQSKEEAYRTIGKMYLNGLNPLGICLDSKWDKDRFKAVITIDAVTPETATTDEGTSAALLVAEGMGIAPSLLVLTEQDKKNWNNIWNKYSVDDLYQKMLDAWLEYEAYADMDGLEAYKAQGVDESRTTIIALTNEAMTALGYTLSYHFQQRFVPQSLKDKYLRITKEIQTALRKRLQKVDWMSETTKQNAIDKLDHYRLNVAFPDTWHMDCIPALADCETLVEALHRLKAANNRLMASLIGTNDQFSQYLTCVMTDSNDEPVSMDLTLVNATYTPEENSVTIYPGILMPPFMPADGMSEACYYAVFSIIGHEFTHGFDNNGAQRDKYGEEKNWWTVADMMAFQDRKQNLIRTYNSMELDPKRAPLVFCNGERTQSENIADLGGFLAALDAYMARLDQQGFTGETRNEQLRKFYEAYAHVWCVQYGQKKFDILKGSDNHAHGRLRVNGVVMNTDLWYELYNVDSNNILYLPPERRAYIW